MRRLKGKCEQTTNSKVIATGVERDNAVYYAAL
jgi:hypothetical protein